MGVFDKITKLKRNRTYDYTPRYYKNESGESPFKLEQRFEKYRTTVGSQRGLKRKLGSAMADLRREGDRNLRIRFLIILAVLFLVFAYIIDFDFSIFLSK
ncbi:riboflavin synthase subunit beta [Maribacter sp. 2-571]|uniref:riboflavin synthase subunit beta n=1 Tax=Maribacter sp. 2-571 TaxID=3417569 RepID=UPI003D334B17